MQRFEAVAQSSDTAFVLSDDWRILRVNDGYRSFAQDNGGAEVLGRWPVGARIDGVIPKELWPFYSEAFARVHATQQHWEHDYECSSAEVYRRMHMVVYPLGPGAVLVVSSPTIVREHTQQPVPPALYERRGVLVTCSHCRRFRSPVEPSSWHWVPDYVRHPPQNVSHGLCPVCLEHYYPA